MSDTQVTEPEVETAEAAPEAKPEKPAKVDPTKPCYCSFWEVYDPQDEESVFTTGCAQTTKRQFAQGHDARLVSFLVDGHFDGYAIRFVKDATSTGYDGPVSAAATASAALKDKAEKAVANRKTKQDAKEAKAAEREAAKKAKAEEKAKLAEAKAAEKAAKAAAPKDDKARVVEGSQEGDRPVEGARTDARIKVGRYTYENVEIDAEGNATFVHEKTGETQVVPRDGYRLLG